LLFSKEKGREIMDLKEFLLWEQATRDCIDVKKIYVDMADDLVAGILLSQIVYWFLPDKEGKTKLRVEKDGHLWLVKGREDWWDECRIKPRQFDTAFKKLEEQGLVEKKTFKFNGDPTIHIRILWDKFLSRLQELLYQLEVTAAVSTVEEEKTRILDFAGFNESVKTDLQIGEIVLSKSVKTITKNTDIDSKIEGEREDAVVTAPVSESDLEFEYLLLKEIVEYFYPKDRTGGDLRRYVDAADIWRMWRTKYRDLTIYHVYAAIYTTNHSPGSTGYDATAIIMKRLEHAQELLIPMKQAAMNNVSDFKRRLIEKMNSRQTG
jgi:hypothetical protein